MLLSIESRFITGAICYAEIEKYTDKKNEEGGNTQKQ